MFSLKTKKFFGIFKISLLVLVSLFSEKGRSACGLSLSANDIVVAWDLNFSAIAVSVTVTRSTTDACSYALLFSKGGGASYITRRAADGASSLRYQLYKDNALSKVLKENPDISTIDDVVDGGFMAGAVPISQTLNYYFDIPYNLATTPALVSGGTYTDSFLISLYEDAGPPYSTLITTKTINITVTVPKMIALSLVDSGGSFQLGQLAKNVNFGTLAEGASAAMDLRMRTNAGFSVTFSSANNGKFKHTDPGKNSLVPYKLYVNGVLLNMSNSFSVPVVGLSGSGSTSLSGLAYPVKVVVGSVSGSTLMGGPHADDITITATTTE